MMKKCKVMLAGLIAGTVYAQAVVLFDENFDTPGVRWQGSALPGAGGVLIHNEGLSSSHLIMPVRMPAGASRLKLSLNVRLAKGQFGFGFAPVAQINDKTRRNSGQPWVNLFGVNGGTVYTGPYAVEAAGELEKNVVKMQDLQLISFELIRNGTAWTYRVLCSGKVLSEGPITVDPENLKYFFIQFRESDKGTVKNGSSVDSIRLEADVAEPIILG